MNMYGYMYVGVGVHVSNILTKPVAEGSRLINLLLGKKLERSNHRRTSAGNLALGLV